MGKSTATVTARNHAGVGTTTLPTRISAMLLLFFSSWYTTSTTTTAFVLSPPPLHTRTIPALSSASYNSNKSYLVVLPSRRKTAKTSSTTTLQSTKSEPVTREIHTPTDLELSWEDATNEAAGLTARGNTQMIGSPDHPEVIHPVVRTLHDRKRRRQQAAEDGTSTTTTAEEIDNEKEPKIALVIEGGGMRGCVTAGMVCAIDYLGLRDCVDVVYGSSAGSIIGAYFVTGQLPWFGPEVYYDQLTTAGKSFIDTSRLMRALGLGILNPKLIRDVVTRRNSGKPILDLDFLLQETMQRTKPLDWDTFEKRQQTKTQPLKIVASGLKREESLVMDYGNGHFVSLEELARCMHASALLPGIAGPMVNLLINDEAKDKKPKFVVRNNFKDEDYEPLMDALVYAPIPYEAAVADGATHMVVLRSKPDGGDVIGKGGNVGEKLVWSRFLLRKNKLPKIYRRMRNQLHKKHYAKSVLELNEAAAAGSSASVDINTNNALPPTLTVAIPPDIEEIARLEVGREAVFEGVRNGFVRAYDALVEDPAQRGKGHEVAKLYFPDEILDYSPQEMLQLQKKQQEEKGNQTGQQHSPKSAFETYLEVTGIWPKAWEGLTEPPLGHSTDRALTTKKSSSSNSSGNKNNKR
uniref:PNPLA domain-containing protein n=1 Tax=Pseudo-nitzschia australis TaxID=44445 RepID=A0A6V0BQM7_9STRA|mmetsp:Transcript_13040/g.27453  ORF Transcript_13040/g.27453 Transcript_13040/m.27453 type:complete len:635 (-) Transcript_13040:298-2202(-)